MIRSIRSAPRLRPLHVLTALAIATSAIGCSSADTPPPAENSSTPAAGAPSAEGAAPGQPAPGQPAAAPPAQPQTASPAKPQTAAAPAAIDMPPTSGYLTSQDAGARINVREAPTTSAATPHYGVPGDSVTLLQYAEANDGYVWYYISFDASGATGWVRGDFVATGTAAASNSAPAASGVSQTVEFAAGASSATLYNSVVRGTQDTYYLSFAPNQVLTASVGSTESNASFALYVDVEGTWMPIQDAQDTDYWYGVLPYGDSGELMVVVGPTRGNATYELYLGIE